MTVPRPRWMLQPIRHCDAGNLPMATFALAVAATALAVAATALWLCLRRSVRSLGSSRVRVYGVLSPGTQAQVTVKETTPPKTSQPPRPREEPPP